MINKTEKGQALIIIALAAVVLFGFAALAIDGSMAFSDRRHAQNAADTAALAGALAFTRGSDDPAVIITAKARATDNDYTTNGDATKIVDVSINPVSTGTCPGNAPGVDIEVKITSVVSTTFSRILGKTQLTNVVSATARGCRYVIASLFPGNAIVSISDTHSGHGNGDCGFDTGGNATWTVEGGGVFSNGCAANGGSSSVHLDSGYCVTAPSGFIGQQPFNCQAPADHVDYGSVADMMPENPCNGDPGDVGLPQSSGITSGNTVTFNSGVYCISDMDAFRSMNIQLNNATLYVTDDVFDLQFSGGGGFSGTATDGGTYDNYYMIIAIHNPACESFTTGDQVINYRGNGTGSLEGTILAPSTCIDLRGNGTTENLVNSQVIGYNVSSNGGGNIHIVYDPDDNHQDPHEPFVTMLK
jgi:Flp pilus assembly protein TadG